MVGKDYGTRFYPTMSGVLRSLNYYPIGDEEAEEGIASLALGLGKYIVDGGQTLRVCPYHPHQVLLHQATEIHTHLLGVLIYKAESLGFCLGTVVALGTLDDERLPRKGQ